MPAAADLILTLWLTLALPAFSLATSIAQRGRPPRDRVRRYQRTIIQAGLPLIAVAALWASAQRPLAWLGLGAPSLAGAVLLAAALAVIAVLAILAPREKRPTDPARLAALELMTPRGPRETRWFLLFALAVGGGWEILYRGYLFWALAPRLSAAGAVAVMGVSYGAAHGYRTAGALAGSIASALLFAAGYAWSGSLWWLIVVHTGLALVGLRLRRAPA